MRTAPQLLVTGGPASDDPSDNGRPVELRYDAALRRIAAEQASLRSAAAPPGDNEDMATALPRRPSSAAPVLRKGEPYLRAVSSRPGSATRPGSAAARSGPMAARRAAPLRPTDEVAAQSFADEPMTSTCGETPPAAAARCRPSSAQPRATRCGSCGSCASRPGSASASGLPTGGASVPARPASAALGRGAAGRSSPVTLGLGLGLGLWFRARARARA